MFIFILRSPEEPYEPTTVYGYYSALSKAIAEARTDRLCGESLEIEKIEADRSLVTFEGNSSVHESGKIVFRQG